MLKRFLHSMRRIQSLALGLTTGCAAIGGVPGNAPPLPLSGRQVAADDNPLHPIARALEPTHVRGPKSPRQAALVPRRLPR
ncbi:MAG: hypothetical protein KGS61_05430 [Verrucomicrobia bacterium]|nr:hypothetical protein [Verrucomicrobiota bacterium]